MCVVAAQSREHSRKGDSKHGCECDGQVTFLQLRHNSGVLHNIRVTDKKNEKIFFQGAVGADALFSFGGDSSRDDRMGSKINFYVNGTLHYKLHTSCSEPIFNGFEFATNPSFTIVVGQSRNNGNFCNGSPPPPTRTPPSCNPGNHFCSENAHCCPNGQNCCNSTKHGQDGCCPLGLVCLPDICCQRPKVCGVLCCAGG